MEITKNDSMVACQLCYAQVSATKIIEHLKAEHRVADGALYDNKPLKSWYKPVLMQ